MRPDTTSRTEAGAGEHAAILGASEWIGGGGGDQELVGGIGRLGADPWLPFSCPRCGDEDRTGMPEVCPCGWRNYGSE